jgi:hypothetical protein
MARRANRIATAALLLAIAMPGLTLLALLLLGDVVAAPDEFAVLLQAGMP